MNPLTDKVLETMTSILVEAGTLAYDLCSSDDPYEDEDRQALLDATSRITAAAQTVVDWLRETPLETLRQ